MPLFGFGLAIQCNRDLPEQVVSLHCALDDKTKHLADKKMLGMMKEDAILINAARGPIHHEDDLVAHLKANPNFRSGPAIPSFHWLLLQQLNTLSDLPNP